MQKKQTVDVWDNPKVLAKIEKELEEWKKTDGRFNDGVLRVGRNIQKGKIIYFSSNTSETGIKPQLIMSHTRFDAPVHSAWLICCLGTNHNQTYSYSGVIASNGKLSSSQGPFPCFEPVTKPASESGIHYLEETFTPKEVGEGVVIACKEFFVCVDKSTEVKLLYQRAPDGTITLLMDKTNGKDIDLFAEHDRLKY